MARKNKNNDRKPKNPRAMAGRKAQNLISLARAGYQNLDVDRGIDIVQYVEVAEELAENIEQFHYPPLELPHSETKDFVSAKIRELVWLSNKFVELRDSESATDEDWRKVFNSRHLQRVLEFFKKNPQVPEKCADITPLFRCVDEDGNFLPSGEEAERLRAEGEFVSPMTWFYTLAHNKPIRREKEHFKSRHGRGFLGGLAEWKRRYDLDTPEFDLNEILMRDINVQAPLPADWFTLRDTDFERMGITRYCANCKTTESKKWIQSVLLRNSDGKTRAGVLCDPCFVKMRANGRKKA